MCPEHDSADMGWGHWTMNPATNLFLQINFNFSETEKSKTYVCDPFLQSRKGRSKSNYSRYSLKFLVLFAPGFRTFTSSGT